jgi:hypothetical protein
MKNRLSQVGFLLLGLLVSCSDSLDFGQYEDASLTPFLEAAFLYVQSSEAVINESDTPVFLDNTFAFVAFSEQFVAERILDGEIVYQLENTTSKPLEIAIQFLDGSGGVLDTESFTIGPEPAPLLNRTVAYGSGGKSLNILRNTVSLRVIGTNQGDNTSTAGVPEPRIVLRSTARFVMRLAG